MIFVRCFVVIEIRAKIGTAYFLLKYKIGELFKMDYSAVSQIAKRFEQKSEVNDKIKENLQKVIRALKEI